MAEAPSRPLGNPFLALRPFTRKEASRFFGRDSDLVLVQSRFYSARTTLLFAGSGVGKTSFLEARLGPSLENQWLIVTNRWWAALRPLEALQHAITAAAITPDGRGDVTSDEAPLERIVAALPASKRRGCIVILDQFEEVFQHWRDTKALDDFAVEVARLVHATEIDARILISMREDFLGDLSLFDNVIPDLFNNCYRLKNPTRVEADEIISRTVSTENVECGPGLELLIEDLVASASRPGHSRPDEMSARCRIPMPFLQIVCHRLWQQQMMGPTRPPQFLATKPGSVRAELEAYCREKLDALSKGEQHLAAAAFGLLMTRSGAKMAYPADLLAELARVDKTALLGVLKKLAAPDVRILREVPAGKAESSWFELYHDAYASFLTDWKREHDDSHEQHKMRRFIGAAVILIAAGILATSVWQSRTAAREQRASTAKHLLEDASNAGRGDGYPTALGTLLTVEAFALAPDEPTRTALQTLVQSWGIESSSLPFERAARVLLNPSGEVLASLGTNSTRLQITRVSSADPIGTITHDDAVISDFAFSPDGATIATVAWNGTLKLSSSVSGKTIRTIAVASGYDPPERVVYSSSGKTLAIAFSGESESTVEIRAGADGELVRTISLAGTVDFLALNGDDRVLLTGEGKPPGYEQPPAREYRVTLTSIQDGRTLASLGYTQPVVSVAFSADRRMFAVARADGTTLVASAQDGQRTMLPSLPDRLTNVVRFGPAGRFLATGQGMLWDLKTWQPHALFDGTAQWLEFSGDDDLLVVGAESIALLFKPSTQQKLTEFKFTDNVTSISTSRRGNWLALRVGNNVRLFHLSPPVAALPATDADLLNVVCGKVGRTLSAEERKQYLQEGAPTRCDAR